MIINMVNGGSGGGHKDDSLMIPILYQREGWASPVPVIAECMGDTTMYGGNNIEYWYDEEYETRIWYSKPSGSEYSPSSGEAIFSIPETTPMYTDAYDDRSGTGTSYYYQHVMKAGKYTFYGRLGRSQWKSYYYSIYSNSVSGYSKYYYKAVPSLPYSIGTHSLVTDTEGNVVDLDITHARVQTLSSLYGVSGDDFLMGNMVFDLQVRDKQVSITRIYFTNGDDLTTSNKSNSVLASGNVYQFVFDEQTTIERV